MRHDEGREEERFFAPLVVVSGPRPGSGARPAPYRHRRCPW
ncbi:hypothetical protein [Nocardioides convexus]|nr:hypothetical protein [Nocardioides convexus]